MRRCAPASLKSRAKTSTNNADSIQATLWGLPDVRHVVCLENFTDTVDAAGVPAHGINVIVEGGRDEAIAEVIYHHKTLGTNMRGEVRVEIKTNTANLERSILTVQRWSVAPPASK